MKPPEFRTLLSSWIVVDEYCAMRVLDGSDLKVIANRMAFIEKTPRVRFAAFQEGLHDSHNWRSGPGGSACSHNQDAEQQGAYGFDMESRAWRDRELERMGYELQ